jgi:hypothetical protein
MTLIGTVMTLPAAVGLAAMARISPTLSFTSWAKRHQAVSGYWHSLATLARWCRLRSYLDTAAAHGITALNAIRGAIEGKPWLPPLPQSAKPSSRHPVNGHQ